MVDDEEELIIAALKGDSSAFGQLVYRHQDRLFTTIATFIGDSVAAEDVVQEAFVQAYLKLDTFRRTSNFYTWLYRIAFNKAVTQQRSRRIEESVDDQRLFQGDEPLDPGDDPEQRLLREENARLVHEALGQIRADYKAIIVLREMENCDYETIASILEIGIGTVRSRLHRARIALREVLERLEDGPRGE